MVKTREKYFRSDEKFWTRFKRHAGCAPDGSKYVICKILYLFFNLMTHSLKINHIQWPEFFNFAMKDMNREIF